MKFHCCNKDIDPKDLEAHIKQDHMDLTKSEFGQS